MRTADQIQADATPQRPFSNGTEYDIWADRWCYECTRDNPDTDTFCPILSVALLGNWPKEWTRAQHNWTVGDASGSYEVVDSCTEFEQRPDDDGPDDDSGPQPGPGPFDEEQPGQTDIFTFFAEDAIEHLRPAEVSV